ncbi:MAG: hypothetical protein KGL11_05465 [Alphaproteobacteria bacterium]|nr:hypothetical protein [Alphaproteobacteria bacterium]
MIVRAATAFALAVVAMSTAAPRADAQLAGAQMTDRPIHIEADHGIEWQQANNVYIARGNASATRGNATVTADVLYAYYRPVGQASSQAAPASRTGPSASKPVAARGQNALMGGSSTEIYRLEADGHVHFINGDQQEAFGDHAVYDVDQAVMVLTGKDLHITAPNEIITARDSLEWYDQKQIAVARGNAMAIRGDRRMRADIITADVEKKDDQPAQITRINGYGNVLVSAPGQIARGDEGVYVVATKIATLIGHVRLTKGDDELRGQYGVVDTNTNVSEILAAPPNAVADGGRKPRVEGLLVPNHRPSATGGQSNGGL